MNPAIHGDPPRKRNNWLIASVALNLFLLGGIAGAVLLGPPRGPFGERGFPPEGFGPARMLSPAGREQLHKLHQEDRETLRPQLEALRSARKAIEAAFATEPFDRAAFNVAQQQMEAAERSLTVAMGERVVRLAETLSADDRKAFAKSMGHLPMGPPGIGGGEFRPRGPMPPDAPDMPRPPGD